MRAPRKFEFNADKFREAIVYIASKSEHDPYFGAVKLNKALYFADFAAYRRLGEPISGATYQHLVEGPAPRQMLPVRREMVGEGQIRLESRPYFNTVQQRIIPLRSPDVSLFSADELAILDEVLEATSALSARAVSDLSHEEVGWRLTQQGGTIPYESAWLSSDPIPQEAQEYAKTVAERLGR